MKHLHIIAASAILLAGCGHNVGMVGLGTGFRAGGQGYGVSYGDGLFGTFVAKDGVKFKAELDSTQGFSYDPASHTYKGIKSVEYSVAPQITGYAVDFAKDNPQVATQYYKALVKYYEISKEEKAVEKPLVSDEKSKEATTSVADIIKKAIDKAKSIISKKESEEGEETVFQCNGNCEYNDLTGNSDIAYQLSIATKLLTYDGQEHKMSGTGETYQSTLEHFISQVVKYQANGHLNTPLRFKKVSVKEGVIVDLMYEYIKKDGSSYLVECPSCIPMYDEDAD